MSDYGFTPGPLEADGFADCQLITKDVPASMGAPIGIAKVYGPNMIGDARLFAASPTLLKAVLAAEDYFATLPADDAAHSLYLQMNAAIQLATGKDA